jgi:hypothetical protein
MENVAMADIQTSLNTLCYWINISEIAWYFLNGTFCLHSISNRPHKTRESLRKTIAWQRMTELESEITETKHITKETKEQLLRYKLFTSLKRKASLLKIKYSKFIFMCDNNLQFWSY